MLFNVLLAVVGLLSVLYLYCKWEDYHFSSRGVKSPSTFVPFVGHMMEIVRKKEHFRDWIVRMYSFSPGESYIGVRQFLTPLVMVRDLDLVKQIAIKDFDHFTDHLGIVDETSDPLFGNNLFTLKGQKWRDMRATMSPAFTSAKMRGMFDFVAECGQAISDFYLEEMKKPDHKNRSLVEVEMKDAFTRYTNDVIATTAFGLEVDSLKDRDNEFYKMGKQVTDFSGGQLIKIFLLFSAPKLMKFLKIAFFTKNVQSFFRNLVADTMAGREKNNIVRNDMIQILMDAKKGVLKHEDSHHEEIKEAGFATVEESAVGKETVKRRWTDDELTAQALLFFIAGFDDSSTLLCFLAHELMLHPDIQQRLQEEIDEVASNNKGKLNYNDLQGMKYMDMVVSETLRYWPPAVSIDRRCVKPYTLPPPNKNSTQTFQLQIGEGVLFPIYGIHHDPRYYKDPETFDPERFSEENKGDIRPLSFVPFGIGPRNCIGSRFALMEAKAVIYHLLRNFDFVRIPRTQDPLQLKIDTFNMHASDGFWIGLKPRNIGLNETIWIPVIGIHHDPQYYENPSKFDPERFSDENKGNINPMTYMPFGVGPRNCIGSRFALMSIKAIIFFLLLKFDLVPVAKTESPLKLNNRMLFAVPYKGFWIGLKPRN